MQITETMTRQGDTLVDRARALHDFIASHREENERNRVVSPDVMDALKESGILRGLQSVNYAFNFVLARTALRQQG